jgi:hypothetical protein
VIDGISSFQEIWSWFFLLASFVPLYRLSRIHYFEGPAQVREFARWIEQAHPTAWGRLPAWQRKYLNPLFGIQRIRREGLVIDPEFDRRCAALKLSDRAELRLILIASAFMALALAPLLLGRLGT